MCDVLRGRLCVGAGARCASPASRRALRPSCGLDANRIAQLAAVALPAVRRLSW